MAKTCLYCDRPVFSNKCCKYCQHRRTDYKYLSQKNKVKKVSPIKSSSKPIKKVSDTMKKNLAIYKPRRDKYMEEHPVCEAKLPGCTYISNDLHHIDGREGEKLYDVSMWMSCCRNCHSYIHGHDKECAKLGFIIVKKYMYDN